MRKIVIASAPGFRTTFSSLSSAALWVQGESFSEFKSFELIVYEIRKSIDNKTSLFGYNWRYQK